MPLSEDGKERCLMFPSGKRGKKYSPNSFPKHCHKSMAEGHKKMGSKNV